jgi:prepilin signal peptidase PulO-like enzyme (type II secretory pathway)
VYLLAHKRVTPQSKIPFGAFLAGGTMVVLFAGRVIVEWYITLSF